MPAPSPVQISDPTVKFVITVNGKPIPDAYPVISVNVNHEVNHISGAQIVFMDGDPSNSTYFVSDSNDFVFGNEIEISAGYGDSALISLFKGIVVQQDLNFDTSGACTLTVSCKHKVMQLAGNKKENYYTRIKDSDAISVVMSTYNVPFTVQNTATIRDLIMQRDSDWDFVIARANACGFILTVDGDMVTIGSPVLSADPVLNLTKGQSIINFNAKNACKDSDINQVSGEVSFQGSGLVKTGSTVELAGVGKRFSGNVLVTAVNHNISHGDWITRINFGLGDIASDASVPDQQTTADNLQVATVKNIAGDPNSEYRILITILSASVDIWARLSTFYASAGYGAGFLPEIGDEVIFGFAGGEPVILGSVLSSNHTGAVELDDKNNIKTIVTRSKLKLSFDDEKKIIKIETPGGNSFTLNDDTKSIEVADQNSNTLKMTATGIDISSNKDITIKATGNITLDATGKLDLKAKQDAAITGMNVTNTAQVGFTAKGNATAELSASGQTTVKGGIVMIN